MWTQQVTVTIFGVFSVVLGEITAPGIDRVVSDGVTSLGYRKVYGDQDMTVINEVVREMDEGQVLKQKTKLHDVLKPLPAQDVKCLMSVDRYCSKKMGEIKSVLIQAVQEDCVKCTTEEREAAGTVIASMMAYDRVAWKLFLTRSALQILSKNMKPRKEVKEHKLQDIGEPEEVVSKSRYTLPGFNVRVKRYVAAPI